MNQKKLFLEKALDYKSRLLECIDEQLLDDTFALAQTISKTWSSGKTLFLCGNGGSAANAIHIANDFHYGVIPIEKSKEPTGNIGLKVDSLSSNQAIVTCLANDLGYKYIYSHQLMVKSSPGDHLIILSGSGNSDNVVEALKVANDIGVKTTAIVAYDGGECKKLANECIHINTFDMQIAEDVQLIISHLCMQYLKEERTKNN